MSTAKSSIATGSAGAGHEEPVDGRRVARGALLASALIPFAVYALALTIVCALFPYRPALDDNEWLYLAHSVAERGQLAGDSVFMRVPLWQLMLGGALVFVGDRAAVLGLQAAVAAGAFALLALRYRASAAPLSPAGPAHAAKLDWNSATLVALIFALSPQLVLYSRHAVTELWVGLFAMAAVALGERREKFDLRRAAMLGVVMGAAAMTKLSAAVLWIPAAVYAWNARDRLPLGRALPAMAVGFGAVVVPLFLLAALQRGLPLDDTSAFTLGPLDTETWEAAGSPAERSALSMQALSDLFASDPLGYVAGVATRAVEWFAWPSSLDILAWIPEYPALLVEGIDQFVFFAVLTLAALGTTRRSWPAWLLPVAFWAACSLGQKTPHSPKISILFPLLLLAPAGLDVLRGRSR